MASALKNLSSYDLEKIPDAKGKRYGIVVSEWNIEITNALCEGAYDTLLQHGCHEKDIIVYTVPGSFELSFGAKFIAEQEDVDAVICLGCVIQGETRHFDFICDAVAHGITQVSIEKGLPVIFGVLTTQTLEQAQARSGGKHGNKGVEAAVTAIKMTHLKQIH